MMSDDHRNIGVVINEKDRTHWTYYESAVVHLKSLYLKIKDAISIPVHGYVYSIQP
jgi:hypothetical protein